MPVTPVPALDGSSTVLTVVIINKVIMAGMGVGHRPVISAPGRLRQPGCIVSSRPARTT